MIVWNTRKVKTLPTLLVKFTKVYVAVMNHILGRLREMWELDGLNITTQKSSQNQLSTPKPT